MKKTFVLLCVLCACIALGVRPALALGVKASDGAVSIENSYYKLTVAEKGGAIRPLILKSTGENVAASDGIGGDIEALSNNRNNLVADYRLKVVMQGRDEAQVSAVLEASDGIIYEKTYTFRDSSPLITVGVRAANNGGPKSFVYRVFNAVTPDGRCAGNVYFVDKTPAPFTVELPQSGATSNNFVKDASTGWAGVLNPENRSAILCKSASSAVDQHLIYLSANVATLEWYYKRVSLDKGAVFSTEYLILSLSNVTSAAASIAAAEKFATGKSLAAGVESPASVQTASGSDTVLVTGAFDIPNLFDPYAYRIIQSLSRVPGLKVDTCSVSMIENPHYKTHYVKGFPASSLAKYRAVVIIDTPAWALDSGIQDSLIEYVKGGGTLVMAGDHARGYKGSKLEEIFPLVFDHSAEIEAWGGTLMNDKIGWLKPAVDDASSPLLTSMDSTGMPNVVVHKSTPAKDARIIVKAGDYPLIAERALGSGRVVSFPLSLTTTVWAGSTLADGVVNKDYWDGKIVAWDFYDELWRNLVFCNGVPPSVSLAKFSTPDKEIISPAEVKIGTDMVNNTNAVQSGRAVFTLLKGGKALGQDAQAYTLQPGAVKGVVFKANLQTISGEYNWRIEVKDSADKLIAWADGNFTAHPATWVKLTLPMLKVFGREGRVNLTVTASGLDKMGACTVRTVLADSRGKVIHQLAPAAVNTAEPSISQQIKLGNLKTGDYRVTCELLAGGRTVDIASEGIYIAPAIDKENLYPNVMYSSLGSDRNRAIEAVHSINDLGFNGLQIYNGGIGIYKKSNRDRDSFSNQCVAYEEAEKLGMVFTPCTSYSNGSWGQWSGGCPVLPPSGFGQQQEDDAADYHEIFGESPRHLTAYIADEPSVWKFPWTTNDICKAAFKAKYGRELTGDKKSRDYYDSFKFIVDSQADTLKSGLELFKKYNPNIDVWACLNLGGSMFYTNANKVSALVNYPGVDHYQYGTDPYALDMLWSMADFADKTWLISTTSILYDGGYYPEYAGTQVYNAICHNAKGMAWFIWDGIFGINDAVRENPSSSNCMKRACTELSTLGPLFKHLSRARSDVAMLFPWTSSTLSPDTMSQDQTLWKETHALFSRKFGQIDFLQEEQIRRGAFLPDYKVLVLAGARYLPEDVAQRIKEWVLSGGTLVILPGAPEYNQYQEKSDTLSGLFSASYGKGVTAMLEGGSGMPVRGFVLNPAGAQRLIKYKDGSAAATSAAYGTGRVVCLGFVPGDAGILESAVQGAVVGKAVGSNSRVNVSYFPAGGGFYIAAANQIRKSINTEVTVQNVKTPCYAYDILTGKEVQSAVKNGSAVISIDMEPLWGRVIACLPVRPSNLSVTASKGRDLVYNIKLTDAAGKLVNAKIPVQITVTDGEGRNRPEYGGVRVLGGGQLTVRSRLADNDPAGRWQVTVSEKISGKTVKASL